MADEEKDPSQQTEDPTEKRKQKAREEGQIATSKELMSWAMLCIGAFSLLGMGPKIFSNLKHLLIPFLERPYDLLYEGPQLLELCRDILFSLIKILAIPGILFLATALLIGFFQTRFNISFKSLSPKSERISLLKGLGRLFSMKAVFDIGKSCLKIGLVAGVSVTILWPEIKGVHHLQSMGMLSFLSILHTLAFKIIIGVLAVMFILVIGDYLYQYFSVLKQLRMSKKELKDEHKEQEGDPHIRQRLRQIRVDRLKNRMMTAVPKATVVITNPTHYAIALRYEPTSMNAPVVVAKGLDYLALKIRSIAEENDIDIVENPPLARTLYDTVEVDDEIPIEQYEAVASVVRYVLQKRKGKL